MTEGRKLPEFDGEVMDTTYDMPQALLRPGHQEAAGDAKRDAQDVMDRLAYYPFLQEPSGEDEFGS